MLKGWHDRMTSVAQQKQAEIVYRENRMRKTNNIVRGQIWAFSSDVENYVQVVHF